MTLSAQALAEVMGELAPLIGSRIQRVDVFQDREVVLELRARGRTFRVLISALPGLGRVHLIERRRPKAGAGTALQGAARKHLEGRPLVAIRSEGRTVIASAPSAEIAIQIDGHKPVIAVTETSGDRPPIVERPVPERFPMSDAVRERYADRASTALVENLRQGLLAPLGARIKKQRRLLEKLEGDRARLVELADDRRLGELLKSCFHKLGRGQAEIEVADYETGAPVRIPLDPALDGKANLARLFARAKKGERGLPIVEQRRAEISAEIARLEDRRAEIAAATELDALEALALASEPRVAPALAKEKARAPIDRVARRFSASDGSEILVGKGAEANDRLTFSFARGHDVWLHARGVPGAHIVLRLEKGRPPHQEALLDAAHLAAHFSDARGGDRVEIVYTEARWVKKTKGAPAGQVGVSKERTMMLRVEGERLRQLLATQR
jgi:predicted ribosome quality control (RQC) complex YloA/Tae2 family protein